MFIEDIKNLQSQLFKKLRINKKMKPLTEEQKERDKTVTNCDWCKKEFNNDYTCNKCYRNNRIILKILFVILHKDKKEKNCDICQNLKTCHQKLYPIEEEISYM